MTESAGLPGEPGSEGGAGGAGLSPGGRGGTGGAGGRGGVGRTGRVGRTGTPGEPGEAGPMGTVRHLGLLFASLSMVFLLTVVLILATVVVQNRNIKRGAAIDRAAQRVQCQTMNLNATSIDSLIDSLIVAVGRTSTLPPAEKARRIGDYRAAKAKLADCGSG